MKLRLALCSLTIWSLIGCGTPGAPQPPSLHLPQPITDLKAVRRGDKVYLSWTAPAETTDGEGIRAEGAVLVCRALQTPSVASCRDKAGDVTLPATNAQADRRQTFVDDIGPLLAANDPRDFLTYNVIAANNRGRTAGPSNPVAVFLAPSVRAVTLHAAVQREGVKLYTSIMNGPPSSRFNTRYFCRFERQVGEVTSVVENPFALTSSSPPLDHGFVGFADSSLEVIDRNPVWEKPQTYTFICRARVLSRDGTKVLDEFDSEPSNPVTITPHDTFPPAAPQGVQAVYSSGFVDLAWHPNTESDIAGYNVYRQVANGAAQKANDKPVVASAFRDDKLEGVAPGTELTYYVTAVDTQGNESERSQPATELVPKP